MIWCDSFTCSMNVRACEANRALAQEAVLLITEETPAWPVNPKWRRGKKGPPLPTKTIFQLSIDQINRFVVCGSCPRSGIPDGVVKSLFREGMEGVIHRVEIYREYGFDPEVSGRRTKERKEKWREENQEYIGVKREAYRRDNRIKALTVALKKVGGGK